MTAPILNPSIAPYQWNDQKIEYFVGNVSAKNRLRNALMPMSDIRRISRPKVAPAFVLDIVEQFSEGLRQKGHLFTRSSFWDLLLPFSQAIEYLVMHGPERIIIFAGPSMTSKNPTATTLPSKKSRRSVGSLCGAYAYKIKLLALFYLLEK